MEFYMPRLTADTREEFVEYIRRKVNENITLNDKGSRVRTANASGLTSGVVGALTNESDSARTVACLINLAIDRGIKIPVRIAGKIVNIADEALIEKMTYDTGRRIGGLNIANRTSLTRTLGGAAVTAFGNGIDPDVPGRKYKPTPLTVYLGYAVAHGSPNETIIFPSGRASKGKP